MPIACCECGLHLGAYNAPAGFVACRVGVDSTQVDHASMFFSMAVGGAGHGTHEYGQGEVSRLRGFWP